MRPTISVFRLATLAVAVTGATAVGAGSAFAAAPAPCNDIPQITDSSSPSDGHHPGTNVNAAWLSEAGGRLQAVIRVNSGIWQNEHDDAELNGMAAAFLFDLGGVTRFVRVLGSGGTNSFDYGTYTAPNTFTVQGTTTGAVVHGPNGTATIDVPTDVLAIAAGTRLTGTRVLTYDGITSGVPDWVDAAPGGTGPSETARGADYTVGSCGATAPTTPGTGSGTGSGGTGAGATPAPTTPPAAGLTGVVLAAPDHVTGRATATLSGRVVPAVAELPVTITRRTRTGATATSTTTTAADGTFRLGVPVAEATQVRATALGVASQTLTIAVRARVRVTVRRLKGGRVELRGTFSPGLKGSALLLGRFSARPKATKAVAGGRFTFRFARGRAPRGPLQVVYVPVGERADRATSNTITITKE